MLTTVITHATGDLLPASDWNTYVRDNLNWLIQGGANIAPVANTLAPTNEFHVVTGTGTIDNINAASPVAGQKVLLLFQSGSLVRSNGGGTGNIRFLDGGDRYTQPDQIVMFVYDGTNWWGITPKARIPITTPFQLVSSTAEYDLLTGTPVGTSGISIGGYLIPANGALRLVAFGDYRSSGAARDIPKFKLKLGSTTFLASGLVGANAVANDSGRYPFRMHCEILNLGATNVQWASMVGRIVAVAALPGNAGFTTGEGLVSLLPSSAGVAIDYDGCNTGAVDTTVAQLLQLTCVLPANSANNDIYFKGGYVEILA